MAIIRKVLEEFLRVDHSESPRSGLHSGQTNILVAGGLERMRLFLQSAVCGLLATGLLFLIGLQSASETVWCILVWQGCLLTVILKPAHESPAFLFFVLSGVPIYGLPAYLVLRRFKKS